MSAVCRFESCVRPVRTDGLCPGHFGQKMKRGDLVPLDERITKPPRFCEFPGCGRAHASSGYCAGHYRQLWKGKALTPIKVTPAIIDGYRQCTGCDEHKPLAEYDTNRLACRTCRSLSRRAQQYGVEQRLIAELVGRGKCDCCRVAITPSESQIDHCHATGRVRGVLCSKCNLAVGYLNDSPDQAIALAEYLRAAS